MTNLSATITKLRVDAKLTQKQLAAKLEISNTALSNYEIGVREPNLKLLVKIANAFNVTTDYLLGVSNLEHNLRTVTSKRVPGLNETQVNKIIEYAKFIKYQDETQHS